MKKIIKNIFLLLLALILLLQIPFIYRRWQTGKLAEKIASLDQQRTENTDDKFREYKGVIHVHTSLGGHSTGSFEELIAAANGNDLDFVLMTEHYSDAIDTAALTLNGFYGKTLFVGGNEIDTSDGDRFLLIPGGGETARARTSGTAQFLEKAKAENKLAIITYPEKFKSWDLNFDGVEIFNLHTSAKQMNPLMAAGDLVWSYPSYPKLVIAKNFVLPDANLKKFDEIAAKRNISLVAGTDSHSNIGFHLFGDEAGNELVGLKLDPYVMTLGIVRLHVLIEGEKPFGREVLIEALRAGRFFIGFDVLGDTTGFRFRAENGSKAAEMGDTISLGPDLKFWLLMPFHSISSGTKVHCEGSSLDGYIDQVKAPLKPGPCRVEVYRHDLGPPFDKTPWIISNPVYVR